MEWVELALDHSAVTIGLLVLCLLLFNFGAIVRLIIIGALLFALIKL